MRRQQQSPTSPSWQSIRMRSSSLPRVRIARRNSLNNGEALNTYNDNVGNGVRSWAKSWLSGTVAASASPTTSPSDQNRFGVESDFDADDRRAVPPSLAKRHLRRAPVLTLALLRLEEQLPTFCGHLADPSPDNVYAACALIDSTVATASPGNHGSPSGCVGSPSSPRSSPSRSPIRSWLSGSSGSPTNTNSVSNSAMALEGEWERFVLPLFLLAGAEYMYASLGHSCDSRAAHNLSALYQRITKDLNLVREVLCDPLMASEGDRFAPTLTLYYERASSLATSLHALAAFTQIRSLLIQYHSKMWDSPKPDFGEQALLFHDLLPNLPREGASAKPMLKELESEILCWKYLMRTTAALEQCRFAETILSAQKTKGFLRLSSKTCIRLWMRQTLQRLIAMFPIIFDRIKAFSKPLYGFQALNSDLLPRGESYLGWSEDLESQVLDFLRRQDKAGGPSMAVSVVLDVSSVKQKKVEHLKIERGFALYETPLGPTQQAEPGEDVISQWPAVYMRTTVHHGLQPSSSSHGSILENMRRSTSRADRGSMVGSRLQDKSSYSNDGSSTSTLRPWSSESTKHLTGDGSTALNVLEYAPDSGGPSTSWPHASWKSLVAVLTGTGEEPDSPVEETSKPSIFEGFDHASLRNLELDLKSLALPMWTGSPEDANAMLNEKGGSFSSRKLLRSNDQTSFHISALSDYMWLVVMIKSGEESRWRRRRSGKIVEEEASDFLAHFAGRLRMAEWFQASRAQELRETTLQRNALGSDLIDEIKADRIWNDEGVQIFLQALKDTFRLRAPRNSIAVPLKSSFRLGFRSTGGKSPKFGRGSSRVAPPRPTLQISAAALFLGPDLMHAISME